MKVTTTKIVIIIVAIQIGGIYMLYRNLVKPPTSISERMSDYNYNAKQFYLEFEGNSEVFQKEYLNKIINLTGVVTSIEDSVLMLNNKILCVLSEKVSKTMINESVKIKGRYVGYDELFDNLIMNECLIESF